MKKFIYFVLLLLFPILSYSQVGISNTLGFVPSPGTLVDVDGKFQVYPISGDAYFLGNVGIGISPDPTYKLYVGGKLRTNGINESSDLRYKENISPIYDALEKLVRINGVTYDWKVKEYPNMNFSYGRQYGIIAQDLELIIPELVSTDSAGYKSIDYTHLIPLLIEAIKEQQIQIMEMKIKLYYSSILK